MIYYVHLSDLRDALLEEDLQVRDGSSLDRLLLARPARRGTLQLQVEVSENFFAISLLKSKIVGIQKYLQMLNPVYLENAGCGVSDVDGSPSAALSFGQSQPLVVQSHAAYLRHSQHLQGSDLGSSVLLVVLSEVGHHLAGSARVGTAEDGLSVLVPQGDVPRRTKGPILLQSNPRGNSLEHGSSVRVELASVRGDSVLREVVAVLDVVPQVVVDLQSGDGRTQVAED